jgi:hypothetical protein
MASLYQKNDDLTTDGSTSKLNELPFARDASRTSNVVQAVVASLCFAAGIYVFVTTVAMVIHGWSSVPYWDQWDELVLSSKQVLSPWLYSQHNEHRILFPRLLFAIDTFAFAGTNKFNFFCNLALPLLLAGLVVFVARRHVSRRVTDTLWVGGIVLTLLFSAMQTENLLWGFQVQFFGVELAAAASIGCLVFGRRSWLSLGASIGFSAIAVYTLASGMPVPFLAVPLAIWTKRSRAQITILAIAAVALLASYLYGYTSPSQHSNPLFSIVRPGLVHYAVAEIGNPVGQLLLALGGPPHLTMVLDLAAGMLGLGLLARRAWGLLRRGREVDGAQLFFFGIASFVVGGVFLTALGRLKFGAGQALSIRYASPMLLFWSSLAMLAIIHVLHRRPDLRSLAMGVTVLFLFMLVWAQPAFVKSGLAWTAPRREAMTALLANVDDHDATAHVYPDPVRLKGLAAELKARRLALFADEWSTWLGAPLADHIRLGDPAQCRGGIDQVTRLPASGRPQWRGSGWAWDNALRAPPERIVLVDGSGRVIGYGLTGYGPKSGSIGPKRSGWHGHFIADKAASVTAYALLDGGRTACPLSHQPDAF